MDKDHHVSSDGLASSLAQTGEVLPRPKLLAAIALTWLCLVSAGTVQLWSYHASPGESGSPPELWPSESGIATVPERPTLVMFAHPHCACTRASLDELARVLADDTQNTTAHVVFYTPREFQADWQETPLWSLARQISGVRVMADMDRAEAERFQVRTSGHALLYGADGKLCFSGGITAGRGHSGDNPGKSALLENLCHGRHMEQDACVFGCPLFEPTAAEPAVVDASQCRHPQTPSNRAAPVHRPPIRQRAEN